MSTPAIRGTQVLLVYVEKAIFDRAVNHRTDYKAGGRLPFIRWITNDLPSALPLLMPRIRANHPHHAPPLDDLAVFANSFYARSNLHLPLPRCSSKIKF